MYLITVLQLLKLQDIDITRVILFRLKMAFTLIPVLVNKIANQGFLSENINYQICSQSGV